MKSKHKIDRRHLSKGVAAATIVGLVPDIGRAQPATELGSLVVRINDKVVTSVTTGTVFEIPKSIRPPISFEWKVNTQVANFPEQGGLFLTKRSIKSRGQNAATGIVIPKITNGEDNIARTKKGVAVEFATMEEFRDVFEDGVTPPRLHIVRKAREYLNFEYSASPDSVEMEEKNQVRDFFLGDDLFGSASGRVAHSFRFASTHTKPFWRMEGRTGDVTLITNVVGIIYQSVMHTYTIVQTHG